MGILWQFLRNLKAYDTFKMPENLAFCGYFGEK